MNISYLRKIWNYKLVEYQKKKKTSIVFGYPYWLTVDPSSRCNLKCVFCPTGQDRNSRVKTILSLENFTRIIDKFGPYLFHADFCNWGEPLLNNDLPKMVSYAKKYGISTKVDTNLSMKLSEDYARELIRSGLDRMNISLDGASQKTYEVYRRGGDFDIVKGNIRLLSALKKELGAASPHLHWQFLVFKHNEHEIDKAKDMLKEIGADSIGFTAPFCSPDWVSSIESYNNYIVKNDGVSFKAPDGTCGWLWDAITVNADGSVSPCCSVEDEKDDFDNIFAKPFWMLWNGKKFRQARKHIASRQGPKKDNICTRCDHIGASNHAAVKPG